MRLGFSFTFWVPRWMAFPLLLGFVVFIFWNGTPVARWILISVPIVALLVMALHRVWPRAVNAVMDVLTSNPTTWQANLAAAISVVCLTIALMGLALLLSELGF